MTTPTPPADRPEAGQPEAPGGCPLACQGRCPLWRGLRWLLACKTLDAGTKLFVLTCWVLLGGKAGELVLRPAVTKLLGRYRNALRRWIGQAEGAGLVSELPRHTTRGRGAEPRRLLIYFPRPDDGWANEAGPDPQMSLDFWGADTLKEMGADAPKERGADAPLTEMGAGAHFPPSSLSAHARAGLGYSNPCQEENTPVPVPGPGDLDFQKRARTPLSETAGGPRTDAGGDDQRQRLIAELPELARFQGRTVAPLPAGPWRLGIFERELLNLALLRDDLRLTEWFRRQLDAREPATGKTLADLVLVVAARNHVVQTSGIENPAAVFVSVVSRGRWQRVEAKIPGAIRTVEGLLARFGADLLDAADYAAVVRQRLAQEVARAQTGERLEEASPEQRAGGRASVTAARAALQAARRALAQTGEGTADA